jgi:radical SAM protein with 4Fe4S-binding SPASM domain
LESAISKGLKCYIRYTLTERSDFDEWSQVINLALFFNIKSIHYSFAFNNIKNNNHFVDFPIGKTDNVFEKKFVGFVENCRSNGIKLHLCKPIPLCAISEENLKKFILDGILRSSCTAYRSNFTQNLTINPDLSTLPCNAIAVKGPRIDQFKSLKAAGQYHSKLLKSLFSYPYNKNCLKCLLYYRGLCQGSCLVEHFNLKNSNRSHAVIAG